jgi:hypothetical protein
MGTEAVATVYMILLCENQNQKRNQKAQKYDDKSDKHAVLEFWVERPLRMNELQHASDTPQKSGKRQYDDKGWLMECAVQKD